jgi:Trypsin
VPQSQIPWQVYIYVDSKWLCGGTLIAPDWVLTAAYCVKGYNIFFGIKKKIKILIWIFLLTDFLPLWWRPVAWIELPLSRAKSFKHPPWELPTKVSTATY